MVAEFFLNQLDILLCCPVLMLTMMAPNTGVKVHLLEREDGDLGESGRHSLVDERLDKSGIGSACIAAYFESGGPYVSSSLTSAVSWGRTWTDCCECC